MYKVDPDHMPEIIDCTDLVGGLTKKAAQELGLVEGIPVFGGGGDTTFVNIGAGCTKPGYIYICRNIGMGIDLYGSSDCRYQLHDNRCPVCETRLLQLLCGTGNSRKML